MNMDRLGFAALTLLAFTMVLFSPPGARLASAQTSSCNQSSLAGLTPCLPYVETGNTTNPGSDCCQPLGSLLSTDPTCLCQIGPLAQQLSISVNLTRALEVASICKLTIPTSVSSCLANLTSAPTAAPSGSTPTLVPPPTSGSSSGSNAGAGGTSDGTRLSASSFVAAVLIALICTVLPL